MSKSKMNPFDHLNREQRQAVEHGVSGPGDTIAGPVLVAAGAGSGKTAVLALKHRHLDTVEPFVQRLVRGRFGREQKMRADRPNGLARRP